MADIATTGLENQIKNTLGQVNVDNGEEALKTEISTFNKGGLYIGLKLVSEYDPKTNTRKDAVPKLTIMLDGKFINLPKDGKWWKEFAVFAQNFAQVMEGIDLNTCVNKSDVEYGKKMMSKFKVKE